MLFMSHKTGDKQAEEEAAYIVRKHGLKVYMTEWDDNVEGDSDQLPDYIMAAIRSSNAFLVNVSARISVSMWIGYEIGGAHALRKSSAKIMYFPISNLPSVVRALHSLRDRNAPRQLDSKEHLITRIFSSDSVTHGHIATIPMILTQVFSQDPHV